MSLGRYGFPYSSYDLEMGLTYSPFFGAMTALQTGKGGGARPVC
jgi:hypothetical protein